MARRSGSRSATLVNGGVAAGLVLLLASVALVVNPPAPPGIAEFAPQATKPITKAPLAQAPGAAPGAAGCASNLSGCRPTPSARPSATGSFRPIARTSTPPGVASTIQCYRWPDGAVTQTFDPQSPPCIASWDAKRGNGGATTPGVTGSEIRVAVLGSALTPYETAVVNGINNSFQLYGRRIRLVPVDDSAAYDGSASGMKSVAVKVAEQKVFAATMVGSLGSDNLPFAKELASHKVLTALGAASNVSTTDLTGLAPYTWSYYPAVDVIQRNMAALVCSAFAGRPAIHGGVDVASKPRKFAVVLRQGDAVDPKILTDGLAACGSPAEVVTINPQSAADPGTTQQFVQLKNSGVTSLFTFDVAWSAAEGQFATNVGYTPEWFLLGMSDQYAEKDLTGTSGYPQQLANALALATWNKLLPWAQEPWSQTAAAGGSSPQQGQIDQAGGQDLYHSLLLLAAGIQMAGPHLSPATFQQGLQSTTFANPGAGALPTWQGTVGFGDGYSMVQDFGLAWWSQNGRDYQSSPAGAGNGGWCYVGQGRRFSIGAWPKQDPAMSRNASCS